MPSSNARTARSFELLAEPLRREVKVHCYRMLGSVHDAEDVTQDSFLRAWQAFPRYDDSGSFRAWLYRIATNACLNLLADRKRRRRHLPDRLAKASPLPLDGAAIDGPDSGIAWLEPYPDAFLEGIADTAPNAETRYSTRESVRLAFVAVIQKLPPRQRAMLLLSDVLGWSAVDIAQLLDSTVPAVNSGLQRARGTLAAQKPALQLSTPPVGARQQRLLERYVAAWESFDLEGFIALLSDEARLVMPPFPQWFVGPEAIRAFNRNVWRSFAAYRLISTSANGQPAFGLYARVRTEGPWAAHSLQLLSFGGDDRIEALTFFLRPDGPRLFPSFGLPLELGH